MIITVFGASGKVGSLVVKKLLNDGHTVRAFIYGQHAFGDHKSLQVIRGDVHQAQAVEAAIKGSAAVMSCLGSWGTPSKYILSAAMKNIVPAMEKYGIARIVSLTGSGAALPGERLPLLDRLNRALLLVVAGKILRDGDKHIHRN